MKIKDTNKNDLQQGIENLSSDGQILWPPGRKIWDFPKRI